MYLGITLSKTQDNFQSSSKKDCMKGKDYELPNGRYRFNATAYVSTDGKNLENYNLLGGGINLKGQFQIIDDDENNLHLANLNLFPSSTFKKKTEYKAAAAFLDFEIFEFSGWQNLIAQCIETNIPFEHTETMDYFKKQFTEGMCYEDTTVFKYASFFKDQKKYRIFTTSVQPDQVRADISIFVSNDEAQTLKYVIVKMPGLPEEFVGVIQDDSFELNAPLTEEDFEFSPPPFITAYCTKND
eukprot:403365957